MFIVLVPGSACVLECPESRFVGTLPSVLRRKVLELGVGEDRAVGADVQVADVAPPALAMCAIPQNPAAKPSAVDRDYLFDYTTHIVRLRF